MGISVLGRNSSKSYCDCNYCSTPNQTLPNPDPNNWSIECSATFGSYLVVDMHYPDCTNYEGKKILVFKCSLNELKKQKLIDPHFSNKRDKFYPIARFQPTKEGWNDAVNYARAKSGS